MTDGTRRKAESLSVVIPTLNEELYLARTLDSLCDSYDFGIEVIVVDSSLNDDTKRVALQYRKVLNLRYIHILQQDVGRQRNVGARLATYEKLLFLDADTLLGIGTLKACVHLDADGLFVASIKHIPDRDSLAIRAGMKLIYTLIFLSRAVGLPVTNGDFILTTKQTHRAVNGFKEGYLLGEDTDFGLRARRVGAKGLMMWRHHVVASSRRLSITPIPTLIWVWMKAYIRAILVGPTPKTTTGLTYSFGNWGTDGASRTQRFDPTL